MDMNERLMDSPVNLGMAGPFSYAPSSSLVPVSRPNSLSSLRPILRPESFRGPGPGAMSPIPRFTDLSPPASDGRKSVYQQRQEMLLAEEQGILPYISGEGFGGLEDQEGRKLMYEQKQEMPPEKGIGRILFDKVFGDNVTEGISKSARPGSDRYEDFYPSSEDDFQSSLIDDFGYPSVIDPETGRRVIPTDKELYSEEVRTGRARKDLPTYQELEDARAHGLASAVLAQEYGPESAKKAGDFAEFMDRFTPIGSASNDRDMEMDLRNNAVGIQIFKKAGINATLEELAETVDAKVLEQLEVIMGRSPEERRTPAEGQSKAPANFKSPEEGFDVYFPRDKEGFFDTTRGNYQQFLD